MPGGDRQGDSVVSAFCRAVEVGSSVLVIGCDRRSPRFTVLLIVLIVSAVLASRTRWSPVVDHSAPDGPGDRPDHPRRAAGVARPSAVDGVDRAWSTSRSRFATSADPGRRSRRCPFVDHLLALAGDHSGLAFLFAVFVGGVGNLLAFVYVSAVVAAHDRTRRLGKRAASRARPGDARRPARRRRAGGLVVVALLRLGRRHPVGDPPTRSATSSCRRPSRSRAHDSGDRAASAARRSCAGIGGGPPG